MSKHISEADLLRKARIVAAPAMAPARKRDERVFGLHPALFIGTIGCYFAFLGVMGAVFMNAELLIPFVIFAVYIAMVFGVPGLWQSVAGPEKGRFQSWAEFMDEGIETETGRTAAGGAIAQVMILPVLLLAWAVAIAIIVALV